MSAQRTVLELGQISAPVVARTDSRRGKKSSVSARPDQDDCNNTWNRRSIAVDSFPSNSYGDLERRGSGSRLSDTFTTYLCHRGTMGWRYRPLVLF